MGFQIAQIKIKLERLHHFLRKDHMGLVEDLSKEEELTKFLSSHLNRLKELEKVPQYFEGKNDIQKKGNIDKDGVCTRCQAKDFSFVQQDRVNYPSAERNSDDKKKNLFSFFSAERSDSNLAQLHQGKQNHHFNTQT